MVVGFEWKITDSDLVDLTTSTWCSGNPENSAGHLAVPSHNVYCVLLLVPRSQISPADY